ncbi:hypothetical protein [Prosthecodimorpha staleyi]|uniref:Uncharacterized protein n=1 Tax=Prosthecodimorpha staleyi TaxID=2840188 RepID=A0A947GA44_9HYPH|nr:hypothetical protein [Prosthecodimorpha staleyi]MBT9288693.1 hypothetical protein [Prosthecodimorpha staleyi]
MTPWFAAYLPFQSAHPASMIGRLAGWLRRAGPSPTLRPARAETRSPQSTAHARLLRQIEDGRSAGAF